MRQQVAIFLTLQRIWRLFERGLCSLVRVGRNELLGLIEQCLSVIATCCLNLLDLLELGNRSGDKRLQLWVRRRRNNAQRGHCSIVLMGRGER